MPTVTETLRQGAEALRASGVPDPEWDAERLLRHVLGWDRAVLLAHGEEALAPEQRLRFEALIAERAARRPLQQLVGAQAFWHHEFLVTPDVLIPRPETEILVEAALRCLARRVSPVVVDVGTGSGNIALSLAHARPDAEVHATDISAPALAVARRNASPRSPRAEAASGFQSLGSSRAAMARTASSNKAICASKASRNRPEMRKVTSTRG